MYQQVQVHRTVYGAGEDQLLQGDGSRLPRDIRKKAGQIQCVYLDPPFMTGKVFRRKRPWGEKGWRKGSPALDLPGYEDRFADEQSYLKMIRRMVAASRDLLRTEGVFYLHLDWRMSGLARTMCDRIFGKDRFLNEIIWSYESGGRSKKTFSRKHDNILMYAKGKDYRFDITRVPLPRGENRQTHIARNIDEDGRRYSSIRSGGKEYRYYDDEPVYPGDVWSDISILQQRDPERTGYATQKPLKLLERILLPVTNPGDLVLDLCCGSGTALEAAQQLDCRFAGLDVNPEAVAIALSRLKPQDLTVVCPCGGKAELLAGNEEGRFRMDGLKVSNPAFPARTSPFDSLEAWDTGVIEDGVFRAEQSFRRSFRYPDLQQTLKTDKPVRAVMTTDAAGIRRAYEIK